MFRRRASLDSEAIAAAQRRLAALTTQLAPGGSSEEAPGETSGHPGGRVAVTPGTRLHDRGTPDDEGRPVRAATGSVTGLARGRHRALPGPRFGRWGLDLQHVVVALVLVLALVVLAAWWVLRSVPDPDEVELTSTRRSPATVTSASSAARRADRPADRSADPGDSTAAGASPRPATPGEAAIVVDVAGKVRRPGIVELPAGSRVVDAIEAAGGLRHGVDPATVNQARLLSDGEQLVVGLDPQPPVGAPPTSSTPEQPEPAPVNLNAATQTELEALPGIGPVTAAAILAWRDEHGRFSRIDELLEVSGIGDVTFSEISPFVYV